MGVQVFREITVDFSNSRYIIINAKQHDSKSRFVRMTCTNVGQKVNLNPTDYSAFIRYRKSDGYGVFNKCIISTEGQIIFELTEQMLSTVGTSYADLVVIDVAKSDINDDLTIISADGRIIENNGSLASTMTFYINVLEKPLNDWDIESTNEFSALNDLLLKASKDYEYIVQTTKEYMDNAKTSEDAAKAFADSIKESATLARSYAVGDTNTREGEITDCAKYYYEQSKQISEGLNGALLPMGTIPFAQLVNQTKVSGYMYNISDDFVSDATFKDGGNITYPAGTNVYYTADGFWDCLTASLLYGVKGNAETVFRKGFVNITPEDIGTYSKTEIDTIIQTLQNTITVLIDRVKTLEDIIESGDITIATKITDNNGDAIVTDIGDILIMSQEKY